MTTRLRQSTLVAALVVSLPLAGCAAPVENDDEGPDATLAPPSVTLQFDGREASLSGGSCVWYEDSGQLFIEVGDAEGTDYLILAAPIEWLGEELPEGPGADPELSMRLAGTDLPVDQHSLAGEMTLEQTDGSFSGRLDDGRSISGSWHCPEVLDE